MIKKYTTYPQEIVDTFINSKIDVEKEFSNNPFLRLLTVEEEGILIGYLLYSEIYDRIEIVLFAVKEEYRRQGYGSKLIEALIDNYKDYKNITLEVRCNNQKAINLYLKYGFEKKAIREKYYNDEDGILMEKKII